MTTETTLTECQNPNRPFIVSTDHDKRESIVYRPRCGQWTCEFCAEENAARWRLEAMRGVAYFQERGIELSFITLTSPGGRGRTRDKSLDCFRKNFPSFRKRAVYAFHLFEYLAIPEQHKNGVVHMHLIATYWSTQKWIKDTAKKSGFGYIAHVRYVDNGPAAAAYLSKYIGKDFIHLSWPPKFRRVRTSANWPKLGDEQPPDEREHATFFQLFDVNAEVDHWLMKGYSVQWKQSAQKIN